ncbi:alpha-amylase family protein [Aliikangiella sp. G2MR2-5]|uniref:alpha-amylase family protein n=1 Tax=Aliikangiella sp. G2MR2-5 TaxID=2788943 RepID=UPI0018ABA15F|nr:alpha-amylase family protein [Aliikangiella sp. G2MR2-5]
MKINNKHPGSSALLILFSLGLSSCVDFSERANHTEQRAIQSSAASSHQQNTAHKKVIYQVFTRLFGNRNTTNKPWGTIEENGVGKFNDFTDEALKAIKGYGTTHIWYTGVPHHALVGDYTQYGISNDDPDVVKGRAGSPYAVKDYYNVNPDLAVDPRNRLQEFQYLIERTHNHGMKVIIDIVPNHVARNYHSNSRPEGVNDFGASDDTSVAYKRDNNFYYIVGEDFKVPEAINGYRPLNGEAHPLVDGIFKESPAKWTGNGSRKSQPSADDWYETVKINYGVKPDGSYDFERLPDSLKNAGFQAHYRFWLNKNVPDSWKKFRDIVLYWTEKGVDGFRYDMAEMVPVEFWSYLNSSIKMKNSQAFLLAEVYNPEIYRDFLQLGLMDSLYDKVDFYDTMKLVMQGRAPTSRLTSIVEKFQDIDSGLLHFLENHDEQRIASSGFVGDARMGKPAMVVSSLIGKGATLIYFAQALGEEAKKDAGFGKSTRTTIFDYWGLEKLKRWESGGSYSGEQLKANERELSEFYKKLLAFSSSSDAIMGHYQDLHRSNLSQKGYNEKLFSFARWSEGRAVIVVSNFSSGTSQNFELKIPASLITEWKLHEKEYFLTNLFDGNKQRLMIKQNEGGISLSLKPLESMVLQLSLSDSL